MRYFEDKAVDPPKKAKKPKFPDKPLCIPGHVHHWQLECAQDAAARGVVGRSEGQCIHCKSTYTFINDVYEQNPEQSQHIRLQENYVGSQPWKR
jgi:hypothetical protein